MQKGFFQFAQQPQFHRVFIRSVANLTLQLIQHLSRPEAPPFVRPVVLDLCYLCRTLAALNRAYDEQTLSPEYQRQLSSSLTALRNDIDSFVAEASHGRMPASNVENLERQLALHLTRFNSQISVARSLIPPETSLNYYAGDTVLGRSLDANRYNVGFNCTLEDWSQISPSTWKNQLPIYEHISMRSGGDKFYDPYFCTRGPIAAREFFTQGRVFTILWTRDDCSGFTDSVLDDMPGLYDERQALVAVEGVYSGPYEGPTTVRCFVVVQSGPRSSLCLPISGYSGLGCSTQPDQDHYGVVHRHDQDPTPRPDEVGINLPALEIAETPQRQWPIEDKMLTAVVPPPEQLPTGPLPACARIDYRRWCEVALNVHCRNVGLVDRTTLLANVMKVQKMV